MASATTRGSWRCTSPPTWAARVRRWPERGTRHDYEPGRRAGRYDLVIVGARPAGAATALILARQGARVLVIDRGRYGTDTLSTHALMRGGVLQLARWGVLPSIAASTPR